MKINMSYAQLEELVALGVSNENYIATINLLLEVCKDMQAKGQALLVENQELKERIKDLQ